MKKKELFMVYVSNNRDRLQADIQRLQQQVRFRNIDAVDCLELTLATERLAAFDEFTSDVISLLNITVPEPLTYVSIDKDYVRHRIEQEREKNK